MRCESYSDEVHSPNGERDSKGYGNDSVDVRKNYTYALTAHIARPEVRRVDASSYSEVRRTGTTPCALPLALQVGSVRGDDNKSYCATRKQEQNRNIISREFVQRRGRLTTGRDAMQESQLLLPKEHWAFAAWKARDTTRSDRTSAERIMVGRRIRPQSYLKSSGGMSCASASSKYQVHDEDWAAVHRPSSTQ